MRTPSRSMMASLMLGCAAFALVACGENKPAEPAAPVVETPPAVEQAAAPMSDPSQGDGGVSAFYMPDAAIPATPGKMIRTEPQTADTSLPSAASAFRILYSSVNGLGDKGRQTELKLFYVATMLSPEDKKQEILNALVRRLT